MSHLRSTFIALFSSIVVFAAEPEEPADIPGIVVRFGAEDPEVRLEALDELRRALILKQPLGDQKMKIIEECARLMRDENNDVASRACDAISWMDADAILFMVDALQTDVPVTRARAVRAISSIASRDQERLDEMDTAIPHLARLMKNGPKAARHSAFYAMCQLSPAAIPHMIEALDAEESFQTTLLKGFIRHGEQSITPLCEALQSDEVTTRQNAALMLYGFSWKCPGLRPVFVKRALGPLTKAIDDPDPLVCRRAISALGRMESHAKPSLPKIIAALEKPEPPLLTIADATSRIGPETAQIETLFEAVGEISGAKGNQAGALASGFGAAVAAAGEDGLDLIIPALDDPRELVPKAAMYALFNLGPKAAPAVPSVIRKLDDGNKLAPRVLGAIGPEAARAAPHLVRRMRHDEWILPRLIPPKHFPFHRSANADALSQIGPAALPALLEGIGDEVELVRAGCLLALGKMKFENGEKFPMDAVEALCLDGHRVVRELAFLVIVSRLDEERARVLKTLDRLKNHPNLEVATAAAFHLDRIENGDSVREPDLFFQDAP